MIILDIVMSKRLQSIEYHQWKKKEEIWNLDIVVWSWTGWLCKRIFKPCFKHTLQTWLPAAFLKWKHQHGRIYLHEVHTEIGASSPKNRKSSPRSSKVDRRIGASITFSRSSKSPYQRCKNTLQVRSKKI